MEAALTKKKIDELGDWEKKVDTLSKKWKDLDYKEKSYTQLKKDFDEYEKNKLVYEKYQATIETFQTKKETLESKLSRYSEMQDVIKSNEQIESQIIKANLRLEELKRELEQIQKSISNSEFQIKQNEEKIDGNLKTIVKIAEEQEKEMKYKLYLELFGKNGIAKRIMKSMMPLINSELQRLLQDSCYFRLEIRISEKNEVEFWMIDNNTQVEKLMTTGSGYEKTIASLALRAVLAKVCSLPKPNITVFDEVFGKISNDNLEMVYEFFIKIKEYFENILVITHNPMISNWADNVIKISKTDNISKVSQ
jgi:DNA repair exonuclease SbcCD ATPase subunit